MNGMTNLMRREAARMEAQKSAVRIGVVTAYDPNNYAAKVQIQPEGYETGFLPVTSPWTGNGWGLFCPPTPGDVVDVHFQEGGKQAGFVALRHFGDQFRPMEVPSGEFWLVHKSGSSLKFLNDGSVTLSADTNLTVTAGQTLRLTAPTIQLHATSEFRFDADGHGQAWHPTTVNTYQIGEVPGTANAISPPEIGD